MYATTNLYITPNYKLEHLKSPKTAHYLMWLLMHKIIT
jgi:hypothetical protein